MNIQSLVENLATWFPRRTDPGYAMAQIPSIYAMLYGSKFYYRPIETTPVGSVIMRCLFSGQQAASAGDPALGVDGFLSYINYDGVNDYFVRGTLGFGSFPIDLSMIVYVKFGAASMGVATGLVSAWSTGFEAYSLGKSAADVITFRTAGGGSFATITHSLPILQDTWYFIACAKSSNTGKVFVSNPDTKKLVLSSGTCIASMYSSGSGSLIFGANEVTGGGTIVDIFTGKMGNIFQSSKPLPDGQVSHAYQVARPLLGLA